MAINREKYYELKTEAESSDAVLVAVSKSKPAEDIKELYDMGHRDFGENYVQELVDKETQLPKDIRWHFIGHLQSNKVKYIAPFVYLVHGVDSLNLLKEINKQAQKNNRVIDCLLQMHIATEETKFGLSQDEVDELIKKWENLKMSFVRINGLMGMASFTEDIAQIKSEFQWLKKISGQYAGLQIPNLKIKTLSFGMSSDYKIALEEGANMLRIGSLIFGERNTGITT